MRRVGTREGRRKTRWGEERKWEKRDNGGETKQIPENRFSFKLERVPLCLNGNYFALKIESGKIPGNEAPEERREKQNGRVFT